MGVFFPALRSLLLHMKHSDVCVSCCFPQKMQMSHRPVQWLAVLLLVVCTTGRCQESER